VTQRLASLLAGLWSFGIVYALCKKAERIGEVRAANEREALQRALKEVQLEDRSRFRLSVRREA
jgi:hypothetical protein